MAVILDSFSDSLHGTVHGRDEILALSEQADFENALQGVADRVGKRGVGAREAVVSEPTIRLLLLSAASMLRIAAERYFASPTRLPKR